MSAPREYYGRVVAITYHDPPLALEQQHPSDPEQHQQPSAEPGRRRRTTAAAPIGARATAAA